jgi:hypothetical protein
VKQEWRARGPSRLPASVRKSLEGGAREAHCCPWDIDFVHDDFRPVLAAPASGWHFGPLFGLTGPRTIHRTVFSASSLLVAAAPPDFPHAKAIRDLADCSLRGSRSFRTRERTPRRSRSETPTSVSRLQALKRECSGQTWGGSEMIYLHRLRAGLPTWMDSQKAIPSMSDPL